MGFASPGSPGIRAGGGAFGRSGRVGDDSSLGGGRRGVPEARGKIWLEIGESQGKAVRRLPRGGLRFVGIEKDLAGRDRVARWVLPAD